jgi:hypothetical protein
MPIWEGLSGLVMREFVMGAREEVMELTHWVPLYQFGAERLIWGKGNETSWEGPQGGDFLSLDACASLRVSSVQGLLEHEL